MFDIYSIIFFILQIIFLFNHTFGWLDKVYYSLHRVIYIRWKYGLSGRSILAVKEATYNLHSQVHNNQLLIFKTSHGNISNSEIDQKYQKYFQCIYDRFLFYVVTRTQTDTARYGSIITYITLMYLLYLYVATKVFTSFYNNSYDYTLLLVLFLILSGFTLLSLYTLIKNLAFDFSAYWNSKEEKAFPGNHYRPEFVRTIFHFEFYFDNVRYNYSQISMDTAMNKNLDNDKDFNNSLYNYIISGLLAITIGIYLSIQHTSVEAIYVNGKKSKGVEVILNEK